MIWNLKDILGLFTHLIDGRKLIHICALGWGVCAATANQARGIASEATYPQEIGSRA
jgi:hypothetical protein